MIDHVLLNTEAQVNAVIQDSHLAPQVAAFFDEQTFTASYVVSDRATKRAAIIDSVCTATECCLSTAPAG